MNRINPIYIVPLLTIVLLLLIYKLDASKTQLKENKASFETTQAIAYKLVTLKDVYADKTKIKQSLQRVLNDPSLKSAGLDTKFKKTSLAIEAKGMDLMTLNLLLGKLLNAAFIIDSMNVKRASETTADLQMEIKW